MRPRTQAFVEECVSFRPTFFSPIDDLELGRSIPFNWSGDGRFCVDISWSFDVVGDSRGSLFVWYTAYTAEYSAQRTQRPQWGGEADTGAVQGRDYEKHALRLELEAVLNVGEHTRWWFRCPTCGGRRGVLLVAPRDSTLACRRCHHLRYTSQSGDAHPELRWGLGGRPTTRDQAKRTRGTQKRLKVPRGAWPELLARIEPMLRAEREQGSFDEGSGEGDFGSPPQKVNPRR